jgi:hypothetical protein
MFECAIPPYNSYELPSSQMERSIEKYLANDIKYDSSSDNYDIFTRLDNIIIKSVEDLEITIDNQIANEVNAYGYNVASIEESEFQDFDKKFKIFTVEISQEIEDYDKLLQVEKSIKEKLNLFSKDIMLELV